MERPHTLLSINAAVWRLQKPSRPCKNSRHSAMAIVDLADDSNDGIFSVVQGSLVARPFGGCLHYAWYCSRVVPHARTCRVQIKRKIPSWLASWRRRRDYVTVSADFLDGTLRLSGPRFYWDIAQNWIV